LRVRIKEELAKWPDGISTKELAERLGDPQYTISSVVSKMHSYGAGVEKVGSTFGRQTRWRLRSGHARDDMDGGTV
jgi:hypothetical protein